MRLPVFACCSLLGLLAAAPALAQPADERALPVRFVDRPLTLPKGVLAPELDLVFSHLELDIFGATAALNAFGPSLGGSYGITRDLQVELVPFTLLAATASGGGASQTTVYYGTFRLGATYRFLDTPVAEIGAHLELDAVGANNAIYLSGGLPIVLHAGHVVRVGTGVTFSGIFPTKASGLGGSTDPDLAMASVASPVPLVPGTGPGIPLDLTVQIIDELFVGADTGFGIASFRGSVDKSCFMPLGFHAGGTVVTDHKPRADIVGSFGFPLFLLGADASLPLTQLWQIGVTTKVYIPL
jgi:hypothetical protein